MPTELLQHGRTALVLPLPGERKSIPPMAARLEPAHMQAKHQSLHHVVAQAEWDDVVVLAAVRAQVLPAIERHGPVHYWIVDDTSFPKQGTHSVGGLAGGCLGQWIRPRQPTLDASGTITSGDRHSFNG